MLKTHYRLYSVSPRKIVPSKQAFNRVERRACEFLVARLAASRALLGVALFTRTAAIHWENLSDEADARTLCQRYTMRPRVPNAKHDPHHGGMTLRISANWLFRAVVTYLSTSLCRNERR